MNGIKSSRNSRVIAFFVLFLLIATFFMLLYLRYLSYIFLATGGIVGALLFITLDLSKSKSEKFRPMKGANIRYISTFLFFVFYGLSFLTLLQGFYNKPFLYYLLISLCAVATAVDILFTDTKGTGALNLVKSLMIGLNLFLTDQIIFPHGNGAMDASANIFGKMSVTAILNTGHVPGSSTLTDFPFHYILVAENSMVTSISPAVMYYCLGGTVMALGILCVFLIGRKLVSLKFGLIASLIYPSMDMVLFFGSHAHQMSYAMPFAIMAFTLILYRIRRRDSRFLILILILFLALTFTHHLSLFYVLCILLSLLIAEVVHHFRKPNTRWVLLAPVLAYIVFFSVHMIYVSGLVPVFVHTFGRYFNLFINQAQRLAPTAPPTVPPTAPPTVPPTAPPTAPPVAPPTFYDLLPIENIFFNTFGSLVLMMLAVVGFLSFLRGSSLFKRAILSMSVILILLIGYDIFAPGHLMMPQRLYAYLQAFGLVFLATSAISRLSQRSYTRLISLLLIGLLVFFSASSTIAGFETTLFLGNQGYVRTFKTPYEIHSNRWVKAYGSGELADLRFKDGKINYPKISSNSLILLDKFDFMAGYKIRQDPRTRFGNYTLFKPDEKKTLRSLDRWIKLYSNGMNHIYLSIE